MGEPADGTRPPDGGVDSGSPGTADTPTSETDAEDTNTTYWAESPHPTHAPPGDGEFGWRGWVLVGVLILSFVVIPWTLIYLPAARESLLEPLGLTLRDAYLALPMVPAILLAVVAVWAAVRSRAR